MNNKSGQLFSAAVRGRNPLLGGIAACLLLFFSCLALWTSISFWKNASASDLTTTRRLESAKVAEQQVAAQRERARASSEFLQQVEANRLAPGQWSERSVDTGPIRVGPAEAARLLAQAQTFDGHVFALEDFDLMASEAAASIFGEGIAAPQELVMALRGRAYFRVAP
ncbi:MAG: hypothetical protein ACLGJD_11920 [Gammaproteobacteria bacterium]|jgi:hypothetical protein|uniref:hypothetical protein n=1 Tax=Pseudacidovorax sp. TaxID=1934311 RepID=UPI001B566744|nr:hypothetical protein [Pseudacidovorax sp.]MBP6896846.1 hypothetical protein [Pseudacidovorax sp.]